MSNLIFLMLNWSPLFHISCDELFGRYQVGHIRRLSLLVMALGDNKFYFFTVRQRSFSLFYLLKLSSVSASHSQAEIDQKTQDYFTIASALPAAEIAIQYEFLKEAFNSNCSTRSSLETKVSSYASTYLVLAAFYAYVFGEAWKLNGVGIYVASVLLLVGVFPLISCGLMVLSFFRVSGVVRAAFKDIKSIGCATAQQQAALAYTNWFASKSENRVLASYVKNIESYMVSAVALIFFLWFFVFLYGSIGHETGKVAAKGKELTIIDDRGKINQVVMNRFISQEITSNADEICIISGPSINKEIYSTVVKFTKLCLAGQDIVEISLDGQEALGSSVIVKF